MRKHLTISLSVLWIWCSSLLPCWADETQVTVLQVQDASAPGSPFTISGTVEVRETKLDRSTVQVSISENILARNISGQTILTFVARLDITPANGGPQSSTRQYECFFAPDVINPGDEHNLSEPGWTSRGPYDPDDPDLPRAELKVQFVQFLDGSIFGHEVFGSNILSIRKQTQQHLKRLNRAYSRSGEAAFLEELQQTVEPREVETVMEGIRRTQRQRGTSVAVSKVRVMLDFADMHEAGFTSNTDQ